MPNTYQGSCHCSKVTYTVTMDLEQVVTCNCSICHRTGQLLAFVPESAFTLVSGEDSLSNYQFGKKRIHHLFCTNCGVRSFSRGAMPDGSPIRAINVRCLEGVDPSKLPVHQYDGASL